MYLIVITCEFAAILNLLDPLASVSDTTYCRMLCPFQVNGVCQVNAMLLSDTSFITKGVRGGPVNVCINYGSIQ